MHKISCASPHSSQEGARALQDAIVIYRHPLQISKEDFLSNVLIASHGGVGDKRARLLFGS